jgi:HSP20 family molecular chaperone IbpA
MDSLFGDIFGAYDPFTWTSTYKTYPVDLPLLTYDDVTQQEKDGKLVMSIDIPGVKRSDVNVTTNKQKLDISATRDGKAKSYKYDIRSDYDLNTVDCALADGVLTITIAKKAKPPEDLPRKVTVR